MARSLRPITRAPGGFGVALCALIAFSWCHLAAGQHDAPAGYEVYQLRHKPVADVQQMLVNLLRDQVPEAHVVVDPKTNRLLLRGPAEAQQVAQQLIDSLDRPSSEAVGKPVVRGYPYPAATMADAIDRLRREFASRGDVRISSDPTAGQILVLATPEVHTKIARELGDPTAPPAAGGRPLKAASQASPGGRFVGLSHMRVERVESTLRELLSTRLRPRQARGSEQSQYWLVGAAGPIGELVIDRQRNGLVVFGSDSLKGQFAELVRALDVPATSTGRSVRIVPLRNADPIKVQQAYEAYRSGYRGDEMRVPKPAPEVPAGRPPARPTAPQTPDQSRMFLHGGVQQVAYLFQVGDLGSEVGGATASERAAAPGEEGLQDVGVDVQIETLPDLDVIIVRGRERDVEEVTRLIEEIERLSALAEPMIEIYPLEHVGGERLVGLVREIQEQLVGSRQGRVTVTPLVKPNALLLIGWGEAIRAVKELIKKLDRPVEPATQSRVFRLRHAAAMQVRTTIQEFFSSRGGLGPEVQVTADPRTNSLFVQGSPRDLEEVELLVRRLDTDKSPAVSRARIFKLNNTLATDLANTLQGAIDAARGRTSADKSAALELLTIDADGQRLLQSGILNEVEIVADPHTNTLLISGSNDSLELIAALIQELDMPAAVAQIKVFRILNSDANALALMLRTLLPGSTTSGLGPQLAGAEGETSLVPVRFAVEPRTNTIIATGSAGDLAIIEALLLRLDAEEPAQRMNAVYRLKNAPALDVAAAINDFLRSERQVQQAAPGTISAFQQIESEVVVVPEPVSNALIISATPRFYEEIQELIEELDAEPPQVVIQVLIAEVVLNDAEEFGVELGLQDSLLFDRSLLGDIVTTTETVQEDTGAGVVTITRQIIQSATNSPGFFFNNQDLGNSGADGSVATAAMVGGQALSHFSLGRVNNDLGYGGLVLSASNESISILIRALKESSRIDVLSRPQIMTLDNQPAFIQVGKRVPRITGSTIRASGQVNNITLENIGLILGVTPRISPDGMVVMEIDAEKSELDPDEGIPVSVSQGQTIFSPVINLTTAQTTVSAADGETVVLGGMISKISVVEKRRVPFLSDIPVLGHLFRYDAEAVRRTELLIILTPHIVRSSEDADRVKQIEAGRMDWCLADVYELHGPIGLTHQATVIYPDENPRGELSPEGTPEPPLRPEDPTAMPEHPVPLDEIPMPEPAPAGPAPLPGESAAPMPRAEPVLPAGVGDPGEARSNAVRPAAHYGVPGARGSLLAPDSTRAAKPPMVPDP